MMSHSTENLRRGPLLYFTKFLVSKIVMDKRGTSRFFVRPKCFVSQYRIISQKNPSVFQKVLVTSKKFISNSGILRSYADNLLSHSTQIFCENPCMFHKNSGFEIFYAYERGDLPFSVQIVVSHIIETFRGRTPVCSRKIMVSKNVSNKRGVIAVFRPNCFVSYYRIIL